jgi:hypothetical protein
MSALHEEEIAIAEELAWLADNATVAGLKLNGGQMDLDEALKLYAPTLYRIRHAWVPA